MIWLVMVPLMVVGVLIAVVPVALSSVRNERRLATDQMPGKTAPDAPSPVVESQTVGQDAPQAGPLAA